MGQTTLEFFIGLIVILDKAGPTAYKPHHWLVIESIHETSGVTCLKFRTFIVIGTQE